MKRAFALVAVACLSLAAGLPSRAAADVVTAGEGPGSVTFEGIDGSKVTCGAPLALTFAVSGDNALLTESWGPGDPAGPDCSAALPTSQWASTNQTPELQECVEAPALLAGTIGIEFAPAYTLSQPNGVYTLKGSLTECDGKSRITDVMTVKVKSDQLVYTHVVTQTVGTVVTTLFKASATLDKLAQQ